VNKERSQFSPTIIYPYYDIEGTVKDSWNVDHTHSLPEYLALGDNQLKAKVDKIKEESKKKKKKGKVEDHPVERAMRILSLRSEEERLAYSKFAVEARLSKDPKLRTMGFYTDYIVQRVEENLKKEKIKGKAYFFNVKSRHDPSNKACRVEMVKVDREFLDEKVRNMVYIGELINRTGILYLSNYDFDVTPIVELRQALEDMKTTLMSVLQPHEALVYNEIFHKEVFPIKGKIPLTNEKLMGEETAEALDKKERTTLLNLHKELSTGITPLEIIKDNNDESDVLGNRLQQEAKSLGSTFERAKDNFYDEAIDNKYELRKVPNEIKRMHEPIEEKPPSELPPKVNEYHRMTEFYDILSDFISEEVDKGRIPPVISDILPTKPHVNDFSKWSHAVGIKPILSSIIT
jgi:hypothetical protein